MPHEHFMVFAKLTLLLDGEPHGAAWNMAVDESLTSVAVEPTLRVYYWERPALSFGYFGEYAKVKERWPGRELVRRWTGGGEVPHGDDFTYSLMVPRTDSFCLKSVADSYRAIHTALAFCVPGTRLAEENAPDNPACFVRAVTSDLVVNGRKVAGAAQRRGRFGLLHQGSVQGVAIPEGLALTFAAALASQVAESKLTPRVMGEAARLETERYGNVEWLKRR